MTSTLCVCLGLANREKSMEMSKHASLLGILALAGLTILPLDVQAQAPKPVTARNGMVVCSERNASEIGVRTLKEGGNAIDAAVAMAFALAVTYPGAGNIGGGGFLLLSKNDGSITSIDFREKAPLASHERMYLDDQGDIANNSNHDGIRSVGVPGTVAGLEMAHDKFGKLPWKQLLEPAIDLAENGITVSHFLSDNFALFKDQVSRYPSSVKAFLKADGSVYTPGEIWRQPDLAATLRRISVYGKEDFYNGRTAALICEFMRKTGGLITSDDLRKYTAVEREPIHCTYRGYDVYSMGLPSSGGVVLAEMLNTLEGYDLRRMGHNSVQYLHVLTESMRLAYLDRARYLGDIDSNPQIPLDRLASKEYSLKLRGMIRSDTTLQSKIEDGEPGIESPHTTHLSVMDAQGNAVSLTFTIEGWFGSAIVVDGAGFLLNNEMGDFNPIPQKTDDQGTIGTAPNLIAPEKRMLSSMSPTIVLKDKRPFLVIGAPGGRTIPNTVLQVILNVVDFDMDIAEAIAHKRIHHQWMPDTTILEQGVLSPGEQTLYERYGHKTRTGYDLIHNDAMGIRCDAKNKTLDGAADPRSPDGVARGY